MDEQKVSTETALLMLNAVLREQLESALDLLESVRSTGNVEESCDTAIQKLIARVRPKKEGK